MCVCVIASIHAITCDTATDCILRSWSIMIETYPCWYFVIHSTRAPGCYLLTDLQLYCPLPVALCHFVPVWNRYPMLRPDQLRQEHLSHLPNPHDMPIGVQHPYCRITLCACVCLHLCRCTVYAHLFASYCTLSFNQAVFGSSHCILF